MGLSTPTGLAFMLCIVSIAGCGSYDTVPLDADVTYEQWHSAQALESVHLDSAAKGGDLEMCVAQNVQNKSTTLQDTTGSFYGVYTGTYYQVENSRETGGGDVLLYSRDGNVVAQGVVDYQASPLVARVVRYTLTVSDGGYEFTNLEQAQTNTGAAVNPGFDKIGAFAGADPDKALSSLRSVASKIDRCRSR